MGDTLPALRDRNDLRVHFEYQTLAREVFDNIIVRGAVPRRRGWREPFVRQC